MMDGNTTTTAEAAAIINETFSLLLLCLSAPPSVLLDDKGDHVWKLIAPAFALATMAACPVCRHSRFVVCLSSKNPTV